MDITLFVIGFILIVAGLAAGKYPRLIARPYWPKKTLPEVDWKKVGRLTRWWMVGSGISQLIGTFLFVNLGVQEAIVIVFDILLVLTVCIALITNYQKLMR